MKQIETSENYINIVKEIFEKIQKAQAFTLSGNELLKETYAKLNESITPMLDLKEFITGAEKIAGDDVTIKEILDFVKKKSTTGDLNYIINLCKEEHFANMRRSGIPDPKSTIKEIEDYFDHPASVIEQGIKKGIFDKLQSNLLNKIKVDLNVASKQSLNESSVIINGSNNQVVKYNPIGLAFEDKSSNKLYYLFENCIALNENNSFLTVNPTNVDIPNSHKSLMNAISSLKFNPETNVFSLNENWDFNLELKADNTVSINGNQIKRTDVKKLLFESIQVYISDPTKVKNFNKQAYLQDADKFLLLMENSARLVKFDNIEVLRNLNESSDFVIIEKNISKPRILNSSKNYNSQNYNSFFELNESVKNILNNYVNLFESQLLNEKNLMDENNKKLVSLMEAGKEINVGLTKIKDLKKIAEKNSPALDKLNEQESILNKKLDENLINLSECRNFNPYI